MPGVMLAVRHDLGLFPLEARVVVRSWGPRHWLVAVAATAVVAVAIGVPTELIETPLFRRMTPIRAQDYVLWAASALLIGLLAGTYASPGMARSTGPRAVAGGFLSFLAVGCPVCNKVVVLLLGTSGALSIFGPAQVYLGVGSLLLLLWALRLRTRALAVGCPRG